MKKHIRHIGKHVAKFRHPRAMLALLVGLASLPAAVAVIFVPIGADLTRTVPNLQMGQQVIKDAARVRQVRQDYWRAVDVYKRLRQEGTTNLAAPELNDPASIEFYLNLENGGTIKGAAPEEQKLSDAQVKYNALLEKDQTLVDGYVTLGFCPKNLNVKGNRAVLYDICTALLAERKASDRPQVSSSVLERQSMRIGPDGSPIQTLRDRLHALQNVLGADRTYEGSQRPRPAAHMFNSSESSSVLPR